MCAMESTNRQTCKYVVHTAEEKCRCIMKIEEYFIEKKQDKSKEKKTTTTYLKEKCM